MKKIIKRVYVIDSVVGTLHRILAQMKNEQIVEFGKAKQSKSNSREFSKDSLLCKVPILIISPSS